jgi:hypothetical protein
MRNGPHPGPIELLVQGAGDLGRAAPLDEAGDLEDPHAAIEGNGNDISRSHCPPGPVDALTVDAYAARCRKPRRRWSRAHDPGVPEPLVDSLPIPVQDSSRSMILSENRYPLFGIML